MKKNLIVLQDGAKDCGAACLCSIIQYYGGNVTLERLIELTKTTKEGTTFYNLKEASEEIGLATRSYRVDDIEKIKEINIPFICQITKNNYTHFIVVYKIKDNKLLIMDPSIGKQSIDIFDFNNIWTGNIMLFEKVSTLPLEEDPNITNRLIKEVLKNNKGNIIFVMILSLISTILSCLVSLYSQIIFDKIKPLIDDINKKRISKGLKPRRARILVMGVPNTGKSTLINRLVGKKSTNVGNRPGVTKSLEWIRINDKVELLDTPGILWPKLDDEVVAHNLASMTAIKEEVLDSEDLAIYIINKMLSDYPDNLKNRYNITNTEDIVDILDQIGNKVGAIKNNETDYDRVYKKVIKDLQEGYLGKITFDNIKEKEV